MPSAVRQHKKAQCHTLALTRKAFRMISMLSDHGRLSSWPVANAILTRCHASAIELAVSAFAVKATAIALIIAPSQDGGHLVWVRGVVEWAGRVIGPALRPRALNLSWVDRRAEHPTHARVCAGASSPSHASPCSGVWSRQVGS